MEAVNARIASLRDALEELDDSLKKFSCMGEEDYYFKQVRNSVIQCFEFCIDLFWKVLADYYVYLGGNTEVKTPRKTLRECFTQGILSKSEYDDFIGMIEDRNITSHTYDESLAEAICGRVREHYDLMVNVLDRVSASTEEA